MLSSGFYTRYSCHNVKVNGATVTADTAAANSFVSRDSENCRREGYYPRQVFHVEERGPFWKFIPDRIYIAQEEKTTPLFNVSKNRIILLFFGKALQATSRWSPSYQPLCLKRSFTSLLRAEILRSRRWLAHFLGHGLVYKPSYLRKLF
jgi:hypothetical protein